MSERRAARPDIVVRVPSRTEFLALLRDVTRRMAEIGGFDPAQVEGLALAVEEASTRVIEHANAGAGDRVVELGYFDQVGALRIDLVDHGADADQTKTAGADLVRAASGRHAGEAGRQLLGKGMDSVPLHRSRRRNARGNICRMVKRKPPSGGGGTPGAR